MLDSTIELINLAASNSLAVFCFCNMIIVILLVGSLKPGSQSSEQMPDDSHAIVHYHNFKKNDVSLSEESNFSVKSEEENVSCVSITMGEDKEESQDEEEEEDDLLKKRVEEFIEKINKEWRAEKLKTYALQANDIF